MKMSARRVTSGEDPSGGGPSKLSGERDSTAQERTRDSWWSRHTSVATRLAIAVLVVSIVPLLVSVAVTVVVAGSSGQDVIRARLSAVGGARSAELESYARQIEGAVRTLASSPMVVEGVQSFSQARGELATVPPEATREDRRRVSEFYLDEFAPALEEVRGQGVDVLQLDPGRDPATLHLQAEYLADNPLRLDEKRLLTDADDGSAWTAVHRRLHPKLRSAADRFGFEDLFLVDAEDRTVVYSTNKDITFAVDLDGGVHSGTGLARVVDQVVTMGQPGVLATEDFEVHPPALDRPVAFVAAPLFDGSALVGVLVVGLPVSDINGLMSRDWREGRRGETGETYLVGPDGRMRSDSRAFLEDEEAYLERVEELGTVPAVDRSRMAALGTTVLFQEVDSEAARAALDGDSGFVTDVNYLGDEVLSVYQPVVSDLFDWVLLAEEHEDQAMEPVLRFVREALIVTAVFVVALTFFAAAWSNSFVDPLRAISAALARIQRGEDHAAVPARGAREFRALARNLDGMVVELEGRKSAVTKALTSKVEILRTLLPPAAAERVGRGDRKLVETVSQATVVALVIEGLDDAYRGTDTEGNRDLVHAIVDEADGLATVNGLERVSLSGDVYYAVCGLDRPYVDHAPRSVIFALRAQDAVQRIAEDRVVNLKVSAGISSGPVTTGLIGGSRLIYDLWGDTADAAYRVARAARGGQVLVTRSTRERMPAGIATEPVSVLTDLDTWAVEHGERAVGDE
jgi:class 3 adenylate cyclase